jgi:hypothetical protein
MLTVRLTSLAAVLSVFTLLSFAADCRGLPSAGALTNLLQQAQSVTAFGHAGGIFDGTRMWGAVVNRDGAICAYATSTLDPNQVWPGSQAIAKSKAYTANAFNVDAGPGVPILSTANLFTFTQPGHSLWSLGQSNPFDPQFLAPPSGQGGGANQIAGGMIFFGAASRCTIPRARSSAVWEFPATPLAPTTKSPSAFGTLPASIRRAA